jgi:hypothetical protein
MLGSKNQHEWNNAFSFIDEMLREKANWSDLPGLLGLGAPINPDLARHVA